MVQLLPIAAVFASILGPVAAILGGTPVRGDTYEFSVAINQPGLGERYLSTFICGGVLVAEDRVITLAECVNGLQASDISIRAGMSNNTFQTQTPSNIIVHPLFNPTTMANDVALIQLSVPITNVTPAALAPNGTAYPTGTVGLFGWGPTTNSSRSESSMLEVAPVPVVDANTCATALSPCFTLDSCQHFCTASNGTTGQAFGDAGGPVVDSEGFVAGIISGNPTCAKSKGVALEVSLAHLHDWILETPLTSA